MTRNTKDAQQNRSPSPIAIFDLDGTLVKTDGANGAAYERAMAWFGLKGGRTVGGRITSAEIRKGGFRGEDVKAIIKAKVDAYCHELWRTRLGFAAMGLRQVIANRERFGKVVLLTDSAERRAMETLKYWRLEGFFDEIVCNGGVGDKYHNYFKRFDADPAASVVWENEEGKVLSAIVAGVKMENIRKVG